MAGNEIAAPFEDAAEYEAVKETSLPEIPGASPLPDDLELPVYFT